MPNFENSEQRAEMTPDEQLVDLYEQIKNCNERFGLGAVMVKMIREQGSESEEDLSMQVLIDKNQKTLESLGLALETLKKGPRIFSDQGEVAVQELRINLDNGSKFVDFLKELKTENLNNELIKSLIFISTSLKKQLLDEYDLESSDDDRLLNLFSNIQEVINEYQRLDADGKNGLAGEAGDLSKYLEKSRQGILREYVLAEKKKILPSPLGKGFGPSTFQCDSTPEAYEKYWNNIFEALDFINNNPKARDLYEAIYAYLKESIFYAKKDIEKKLAEVKPENKEYWKKLLPAVNSVIEKLLSF